MAWSLSYRVVVIWSSTARTAAGEILRIPLNGEFIDKMTKIAEETAIAQTMRVKMTLGMRGAKRPKL